MKPKVGIIGAGPAGCAAAITLARRGAAVTVFERAVFPRHKVCGEFISPAATEIVRGLVGAERLAAQGARPCGLLRIRAGDNLIEWNLPVPGLALSRGALDDVMLRTAAECGARVQSPAPVRDVRYEDYGVIIRAGEHEPEKFDLVVHADGAGRHDPAGPVRTRRGMIGIKCRMRTPEGLIRGVELHSARGAYFGLINVEDGVSTCAACVDNAACAAFGNDFDALLSSMWPEYRSAWRIEDWMACGVPARPYTSPGHVRSLRAGNAAAAVDPVGGEGIGLALWSGVEVAEAITRAAEGGLHGASLVRMQQEMRGRYRRRLRWRLPACGLGAWALMRPGLVKAVWPWLRRPRLSLMPWYRLTGKPVSPAAGATIGT